MKNQACGRRRWTLARLAPAALLLLSGCGGYDRPDGLVPAFGTATLDGAPLASAQIIFRHPTQGLAFGRTNPDGTYTMDFTATKQGAFVGTNTVSFTTTVVFSGEQGLSADVFQVDAQGNMKGKPERVPKKYRHGVSELTVEVTPKGAPYDFALTSK